MHQPLLHNIRDMEKNELEREYIAIKPKGFNHYLWFKQDKVIRYLGVFIGKDGWGKGGAFTNIKCMESEIESEMYSDEPQYN